MPPEAPESLLIKGRRSSNRKTVVNKVPGGNDMKDPRILADDEDMEHTPKGILSRPKAIETRSIEQMIHVAPLHDPSCANNGVEFISGFRRDHRPDGSCSISKEAVWRRPTIDCMVHPGVNEPGRSFRKRGSGAHPPMPVNLSAGRTTRPWASG